ncbi:MAG TPA: TIGR02996 domain-containing protein [Pirellulales bacterium]
MSDEPFLQAIAEAPDDDAPRLIYADWLDEQGDASRAEFIRVQCELERLNDERATPSALADFQLPRLRRPMTLNPRTSELNARSTELLQAHESLWAPANRLDWKYTWRRGFISSARLMIEPAESRLAASRQWLEELENLSVVERVRLDLPDGALLSELPAMPNVRALLVPWGIAEDRSFAPLLAWSRLESLHFSGSAVTDQAIERIVKLGALRELSLEHARISTAGLARLKSLERLEALDVTGAARLDETFAELLAGWPRLRRLAVSSDQLPAKSLRRVMELGSLQMLRYTAANSLRAGDDDRSESFRESDLDPLLDLRSLRALDLVGFTAPRAYLRRLKQQLKLERLRSDGAEIF